MKAPRLLALLLLLSLAGNAALLLRARRPAANAAASDAFAQTARPAPRDQRPAGAPAASPEVAAALSHALGGGSLEEFHTLLEAAGVKPKLRRELLQVALSHHYEERFRGLGFPYGEQMRLEWWRDPEMEDFHPAGTAAKRRLEDSLALSKQFNAELAELLGEDLVRLDLDDPDNGWIARRFSGLPREKAEALHRIERDYQELEQEIHARAGNFRLPADEEKLRLLKQEQERDIAALLTPEERAEWELRASPTADRARNHATRYRATEEQYRRIFALQKTFDAAFEFDPFAPAEAHEQQDWQARHEAGKALEAGIRAIVGEDRVAESLRRHSTDFSLAQAAAARLDLPADTAERIYALREPAAAESRRLAADPKLAPAERKAALARLAADTRARVRETLGPEAAAAYLERGAMRWLATLESGAAIQLDPDTGDYSPHAAGVEPVVPSETLAPRVPVIRID